ncbi:histone-lysine N-methyltransferase SETMAR [Trichonephila clavipes]|uniref:Histone-lysine N-methyltransferase SETMAR n=1 Tax=Trichonephila clavipes TaxID=2585209 RepID=A0A8X6SS32_TRICX|nr:histone-lysine N-methyltransferase SETMAR [Trichonephila clavipes]
MRYAGPTNCSPSTPSHLSTGLRRALLDEWCNILQDQIDNLILSMNRRSNYVQFWFRWFCSRIFDIKDAPHTGRPFVENIDKITEIIEVDRHVSSISISQERQIDHKTVLSHLRKVGFKKKLTESAQDLPDGVRSRPAKFITAKG